MAQTNLSSAQQEIVRRCFETLTTLGGHALFSLSNLDFGAQLQAQRDGVVPSARLNLATQPTANDTITVGGHVFKWVAALGATVAQTQLKIGASAAADRATLVKALNGTADSVNILEGSTAFKDAATVLGWSVAADAPSGTIIRLRQVVLGYHGQAAYAVAQAPASIAVSEALTAAADIWNCANLNELGQAPGKRYVMRAVTITAAVKAFGSLTIDLPFTPDAKSLLWSCYTSAGVVRGDVDEAVAVSASDKTIAVTLAGGGAPNFQTNDVFVFWISE